MVRWRSVDDSLRTSEPRRRVPILALLAANAVSETGNVLAFVAIPWFVLQTTGSAVRTGLTGAAFLLAAVMAGIFGGPVVDRIGFKRTSIVADLAGAVTVALVPLLYHTVGLLFWQLLVLVFLGGFLDAPGHTARQSLVPDLAGRAGMGIERANSAFQGIQFASLLLGPPLAGLLITLFALGNVLWIDAATFVVSAALVATLVPVPRRVRTPGPDVPAGISPSSRKDWRLSAVTGSWSGCSASAWSPTRSRYPSLPWSCPSSPERPTVVLWTSG